MSHLNYFDAIEERSRQLETDMAAGDPSRLVANYYTRDPTVIAEGLGVFRGRSGALDYFTGAIARFGSCKLVTFSITPGGASIFELGEVTLFPRDVDALPATFSYSVVWTHSKLGWRVALDYFTAGPIALARRVSGSN